MKVIITIASRMASTRMPGKPMSLILGHPMFELLIERLRRVRDAEVVIATPGREGDAPLRDLAERLGVRYLTGHPDDVMARHAYAAFVTDADVILLAGDDDPLLDPVVFERVIERLSHGDVAFVKSAGWPLGMNVWGWTREAMKEGDLLATATDEREHVVPFWERRPDRYPIAIVEREGPDLYDQYRLTVDYPSDLELIRHIYWALYPTKPAFDTQDIVDVLEEHPDWLELNADKPKGTAARDSIYDISAVDSVSVP